jgi:DNA-binding MarR family transcriptional regulator
MTDTERDVVPVSLLSNHGHVLLCIAERPDIRIRDIAARTGLSERAAHRIITELESSGFITHVRVGRRNRYELIDHDATRHRLERHLSVRDLVPTGTDTPQGGRP